MFLLSQVVERPLQGEVLFSLHPRTESCKVLWSDNQAVGFYTVKNKGAPVTGGRLGGKFEHKRGINVGISTCATAAEGFT